MIIKKHENSKFLRKKKIFWEKVFGRIVTSTCSFFNAIFSIAAHTHTHSHVGTSQFRTFTFHCFACSKIIIYKTWISVFSSFSSSSEQVDWHIFVGTRFFGKSFPSAFISDCCVFSASASSLRWNGENCEMGWLVWRYVKQRIESLYDCFDSFSFFSPKLVVDVPRLENTKKLNWLHEMFAYLPLA